MTTTFRFAIIALITLFTLFTTACGGARVTTADDFNLTNISKEKPGPRLPPAPPLLPSSMPPAPPLLDVFPITLPNGEPAHGVSLVESCCGGFRNGTTDPDPKKHLAEAVRQAKSDSRFHNASCPDKVLLVVTHHPKTKLSEHQGGKKGSLVRADSCELLKRQTVWHPPLD